MLKGYNIQDGKLCPIELQNNELPLLIDINNDYNTVQSQLESYIDNNSINFDIVSLNIVEKELYHVYSIRCIINPKLLITIHDSNINILPKGYINSNITALYLFRLILLQELEKINDNIRMIENNLQELSNEVFRSFNSQSELSNCIISVGNNSDLILKIHFYLKKIRVEIGFLENGIESNNNFKKIKSVIKSSSSHCSLLEDKCNFILNATLGLINIQQNNIIKIFSIVSVMFLPPTLIASIYGMNFDFMPELTWIGGYPVSLILMLISLIGPLLFFRFKKWL